MDHRQREQAEADRARLQAEQQQQLRDSLVERNTQQTTATAAGFASLVAMLESDQPSVVNFGVRSLKVQAYDPEKHTPIAEAGGIEALSALLRWPRSPAEDEAVAGVIWNLASHADNKRRIVWAGALPPLVGMLIDGSPSGKEIAAGVLNSLAMEDDNKMPIRESGAFGPLIAQIDESSENCTTTAVGRQLAAAALRELSSDDGLKGELIEKGCPGSPRLRRVIAGDVLVDAHLIAASKAAVSYFAPVPPI